MKVVGNMYGKPTKRMIAEAVSIDELLESESMNEKRGWSFVKIWRDMCEYIHREIDNVYEWILELIFIVFLATRGIILAYWLGATL